MENDCYFEEAECPFYQGFIKFIGSLDKIYQKMLVCPEAAGKVDNGEWVD